MARGKKTTTPDISVFREKQNKNDELNAQRLLELAEARIKQLELSLAERATFAEELERSLLIHERIGTEVRNPDWMNKTTRKKQSGLHRGIWVAMLSDLHLDEVVNPPEIFGMNAYNRTIAEMRLRNTFDGIVKMAFEYHQGVEIEGLILLLGGDIFSGIIHDELRRTNEAPILDSIDYWIDPMITGIEMLADRFGKVHIPVVVGNHGRYDRKPIAKLRARENYDWYFGKALARAVRDRGIQNVTFDISDAPDVVFPTYGRTTLMTHGDQARGGSGWGGVMSPIMRLDDKKTKRQAAINMPYELIVIGHWHQLTWMPRGVVNGSLKGYDEYAFQNNFPFEPPQQAMWLMTPEHGRTFTVPVFCQDIDAEGWRKLAKVA